jgi:hypothetical protein
MSSLTKLKNHEAKGKRGENFAVILLVLARFKTLGQFNIFLVFTRGLILQAHGIKMFIL